MNDIAPDNVQQLLSSLAATEPMPDWMKDCLLSMASNAQLLAPTEEDDFGSEHFFYPH